MHSAQQLLQFKSTERETVSFNKNNLRTDVNELAYEDVATIDWEMLFKNSHASENGWFAFLNWKQNKILNVISFTLKAQQ